MFEFEKFKNVCMNKAAAGGQLELVTWFRGQNIFWNVRTLRSAVQSGNKELIQYMLSDGCSHRNSPRLCEASVDNEDKKIAFESLMYMRQLGIPWDEETCSSAARNGNLEALIYARNNGCPWDEWTLSKAAKHNHIDVVKYCLENRCPAGTNACYYAAGQKNCRNALTMLKLLRQYFVPWDVETCSEAAYNGNLEALKFARSEGCPWNEETFQRAIESEDIATIQYCIESECPFHFQALESIMFLNKKCFHVLKLLQKNGHEWTEDICAVATSHGGINVLRWLRYHNCPWDERTCHEAVKDGDYEMLVYAHNNGCPWTKETFAYCFSEDGLGGVYDQIPTKLRPYFDEKIFNYLRESNCPQPDASDWQINR
ncbi:hypothetical protein CTEN210_09635 [Chaetoceros tenuissimus]|nr:hypothetical protein CTEN210_09635 [Chaetoceros tenuissimus]